MAATKFTVTAVSTTIAGRKYTATVSSGSDFTAAFTVPYGTDTPKSAYAFEVTYKLGTGTATTATMVSTYSSGHSITIEGDTTTSLDTVVAITFTQSDGFVTKSIYKAGWFDGRVIEGQYTTSSTSPATVDQVYLPHPDSEKILAVLDFSITSSTNYITKFDHGKQCMVLYTAYNTKVNSSVTVSYRAVVLYE